MRSPHWMYHLAVLVMIVTEMVKFAFRAMSCPVCGAPQEIRIGENDESHWFCGRCGWREEEYSGKT